MFNSLDNLNKLQCINSAVLQEISNRILDSVKSLDIKDKIKLLSISSNPVDVSSNLQKLKKLTKEIKNAKR